MLVNALTICSQMVALEPAWCRWNGRVVERAVGPADAAPCGAWLASSSGERHTRRVYDKAASSTYATSRTTIRQ